MRDYPLKFAKQTFGLLCGSLYIVNKFEKTSFDGDEYLYSLQTND